MNKREAVLQFEIDRRAGVRYRAAMLWDYENLLIASLRDTIKHGGTFVVVASDSTLTVVQRNAIEEMPAENGGEASPAPHT